MILIDSYSKGRVIEFDVAGGAALAGRNGEGKTTLLSILPLFHGETPSRLVRKGANRQGFVKHYLPHTSSYIVFEYAREQSDICMSVFYANADGTSVNQRFVRAPYEPSLFISEDGASFLPTRELKARLSERHILSSNVNDLAGCRNILHGTPQNREQAQNAQLYSVTPPGKPIPGVERIISGMFQRTTNFSDIAAIVVRNVQEGEDPIQLKTKRDQVEWWVRDYEAYAAVMSAEPRWKAAETAAAASIDARDQLGRLVSRLDGFLDHAQITRDELDRTRASIASAEEKLENEGRPKLRNLRAVEDSLSRERRRIEKDETEYASALEAWTSKDVERAAEELDQLPALDSKVADLSRRKEVLEGEAGSISSRYDRLIVDAKTRSGEQADALRDEAAIRRTSLETEAAACDERLAAARTQHQVSIKDEQEAMDDRVDGMTQRHAAAEERVRNPITAPEITKARDDASASHAEVRDRHHEARSALALGEAEVGRRKEELRNAEARVVGTRARASEAARSLEEARAIVDGPSGSILRFAREHLPDALDRLTRSIPTEILLRGDLHPALADGEVDSVFGITFDVSRLPQDPASDLENARGRMEAAQADDDHARSALQDAERAFERAGSSHSASSRALQPLRLSEASLRGRLEEEAAIKAKAVAAHDEATMNAVSEAQGRLVDAKRDLQEASDARSEMRARHRRDLDELERRHSEEKGRLRAGISTLDTALTASLSESRSRLETTIAALAREKDEALRHQGVDVQAVRRIDDEMRTLRSERIRIAGRGKEIDAWRHWKLVEPPKHNERTSRLAELAKELPAATAEAYALEREIGEEAARLRAAGQEVVRKRDAITTEEARVTERLKTLEAYHVHQPVAWRIQDDLGLTLRDSASAVTRITESERRRDAALRDLDAAFNAHPSSAPFSYLHEGSFATDGDGDRLAGYRSWYETRHAEIRIRIADTAETLSSNIGVFRDGMLEFRRSLLSFNREIQKRLTDIAVFESLSDLEIEIRPSFDKLEYWPRIEAVAETARAMATQANGRGALPDAGFKDAVASLLPLWNSGTAIRADLASLIHISGRVRDKDVVKTFQSGMELGDVSSNGLSYLVLASILTAFVDRIRKDSSTTIVWAVDELRDLDAINAAALVSMLKARRIEIVSAFTDVDSGIMRHFANRYAMRTGRRIQRVLLQDRRGRTRPPSDSHTQDIQETTHVL